jgi:hypothetical protein
MDGLEELDSRFARLHKGLKTASEEQSQADSAYKTRNNIFYMDQNIGFCCVLGLGLF